MEPKDKDVLERERRGAENVAKWYREVKATLDDIESALPDEAYEAKDWVHGTTVSRVLWLRGMYENVRGELRRAEDRAAELERELSASHQIETTQRIQIIQLVRENAQQAKQQEAQGE